MAVLLWLVKDWSLVSTQPTDTCGALPDTPMAATQDGCRWFREYNRTPTATELTPSTCSSVCN